LFLDKADYSGGLKDYMSKHQSFISNPLIKSFLQNSQNLCNLERAVTSPTKENLDEVDRDFKKFYLKIRLTAYITKIINNYSVNYDKKIRTREERYPLIMGENFYLTVPAPNEISEMQIINFLDTIEDPCLYKAIRKLTPKQLLIIELAYIHGLADRQIAVILLITRQAVTKARNKALENMRVAVMGGDVITANK